mmetsp:Transcript_65974/g.120389  ORF Transcript_65974/g.120389 Transcript_65974/m.120389 type:complete len:221 (+) Transcript_65974:338-1000(+)
MRRRAACEPSAGDAGQHAAGELQVLVSGTTAHDLHKLLPLNGASLLVARRSTSTSRAHSGSWPFVNASELATLPACLFSDPRPKATTCACSARGHAAVVAKSPLVRQACPSDAVQHRPAMCADRISVPRHPSSDATVTSSDAILVFGTFSVKQMWSRCATCPMQHLSAADAQRPWRLAGPTSSRSVCRARDAQANVSEQQLSHLQQPRTSDACVGDQHHM